MFQKEQYMDQGFCQRPFFMFNSRQLKQSLGGTIFLPVLTHRNRWSVLSVVGNCRKNIENGEVMQGKSILFGDRYLESQIKDSDSASAQRGMDPCDLTIS